MIVLALLAGVIWGQVCNEPVRRPEIRELGPDQRARFFGAVQRLREDGDIFQRFSQAHIDHQAYAHGVPGFLPWHREYLRRFEQALQQIDSGVVLPYWDWSVDSQSPELSPVLGEGFFGGNGRAEDGCVVNGTFANWQMGVPFPHCLTRRYNAGHQIASWYSPEVLEVILSWSRSYHQFRSVLEGAPHGAVHVNLGGDFATMFAPNDPIFYLHHAFIDLLWHEWQLRNPGLANTYDGPSGHVRHEDVLVPFNVTVGQTMDTRSPRYCYFYPRYGTALPAQNPLVRPLVRRQEPVLNTVLDSIRGLGGLYVGPTDRTTHDKIRIPAPLPDAYILANNLDPAQVRQTERDFQSLIGAFNLHPSFVPLAKLHVSLRI